MKKVVWLNYNSFTKNFKCFQSSECDEYVQQMHHNRNNLHIFLLTPWQCKITQKICQFTNTQYQNNQKPCPICFCKANVRSFFFSFSQLFEVIKYKNSDLFFQYGICWSIPTPNELVCLIKSRLSRNIFTFYMHQHIRNENVITKANDHFNTFAIYF